MIYGVVNSISLVKHISTGLDLCKIQIDFDDLHIFYSFNELSEFLDKPVQYDVRQDMYEGKIITVVANIANQYVVQTIDKVKDIRLIPENAEVREACNFSINNVKPGTMEFGCIAFLSDYELGQSAKTKWIDCKMVDASAKLFNLRIFTKHIEGDVDAEELIKAKIGKYVQFDISYTKYGYQTDEIELYNIPVVAPPEVDTAIAIIQEAVAEDEELQEYMAKFDFINSLRMIIDCEIGYHLVHIASEIIMAKMILNLSNLYDTKLLIRAAITSRGYLLPSKTKFSRPVLNTAKVLKTKLGTCRELLLILDPLADEEATPTKVMYMRIAAFVKQIIDERRGLYEIKEDIDADELRRMSGGLL